jgi:hypothetical protein
LSPRSCYVLHRNSPTLDTAITCISREVEEEEEEEENLDYWQNETLILIRDSKVWRSDPYTLRPMYHTSCTYIFHVPG